MTFSHTCKRLNSIAKIGTMLVAGAICTFAQTPSHKVLSSPANYSWETFNGDYSGRRYSPLTQINNRNVQSLRLSWAFQTHSVPLKSTPLEVKGILYFTVPNHVWAVDAKTGQQVWEFRRDSEGDDIGQRGVAFYNDLIYFGTPDAHFFCLDAQNGKKIWERTIADVKFGYYISVAPLAVKGLIVLGTSGDSTNVSHFVEALDWKTGDIVWQTSTVPKPGTPEARTWPNDSAMSQGGGPAWLTGTYDAALNLIYLGTGNPHPVLAGNVRPGDNLYTCTILALNADTGAIVWYFQPSPHDTHDWDAVETPVLFDAMFKGKPRKLLAQASRNGYFFVLDRVTGKNLLTAAYVPVNWAKAIGANGTPIPDPAKMPQPDGALIHSSEDGGTDWMAPSFNPETGLFYVNAWRGYSIWYLASGGTTTIGQEHQGGGSISLVANSALLALDYQTGKIRWQRQSGKGMSSASILTTAGHLLFTADASGNLLGLDASNGQVLWHSRPGGVLNDAAPMTYEIDGIQYVLTGVDGVMYAWTLSGSL
jgi:alcohol dehydrogenase (cytochrome c)